MNINNRVIFKCVRKLLRNQGISLTGTGRSHGRCQSAASETERRKPSILVNRGCIQKMQMSTDSADAAASRADHLQRTAENSRQDIVSSAKVDSISELSESVKSLLLTVHDQNFSFKAGQWVDFFIPDVSTVGGFSMFTSPNQLMEERKLGLAVKFSKHPPAHWVHTKCHKGSKVNMRVGGDFFYSPNEGHQDNLLLIAGGVGINPLYSIMQYASELMLTSSKQTKNSGPQRVKLLYSASSVKEMLFKDEITELCKVNDKISCEFHVTRENSTGSCVTNGRITHASISDTLTSFGVAPNTIKSYICGPSAMIEDMEAVLLKQGLNKCNIIYEKWW